MCFSVQIDKDIKKVAYRLKAEVSISDYDRFAAMQAYEQTLDPQLLKATLNFKRKPKSPFFKSADDQGRIYPGYFAPVITSKDNNRIIQPMRYRVRPNGSQEEIPSKYNVFNARLDSLEKRKTWQNLFMKNHGIFPFIRFFEWVKEKKGKKVLLAFNPGEREIMWAPCLYDTWTSKDGKITFSSMAIITDDPPSEIREQGHDRYPIFLKEQLIDHWLNPTSKSKSEIYDLLNLREPVFFKHAIAA